MYKKISVIVPTHNKATRLERTLELLLNQNLNDNLYEVIVVNNNSTDNTIYVLEQLSRKYLNLRYVSEKKKGPAAARNRGIVESVGHLLIFIDDDMLINTNHIQIHMDLHERLKQPLCVVGRWRDNSRYESRLLGLYFKNHLQIIPSDNEILDQGLSLASGNFSLYRNTAELIKYECNGNIQYFDEQLLMLEDGDFGYRLEKAGVKFYYSKEIHLEHCHTYSQKQIMDRAYFAGYSQYLFDLKHPELRGRVIIIKNKTLSMFLLLGGYLSFIIGFPFQLVSPRLMLKGIGALMLFRISKGYQQAVIDYSKKIISIGQY